MRPLALALAAVATLVLGACSGGSRPEHTAAGTAGTAAAHVHEHTGTTQPPPARSETAALSTTDGIGSFGIRCGFTHRSDDDPIVWAGQPGMSHRHDFFGSELAGSLMPVADLMAAPTRCESPADRSSYWVPTLFAGDQPVDPIESAAYYRAPQGVDPATVQAPPDGLELLSAGAAWACGRDDVPRRGAPVCPSTAVTRLVLTFPDCWDGEHLRSDDHRSHLAVSGPDGCPASHPVPITRLVLEVRYHLPQGQPLRFSAGPLDQAHGDAVMAWDRAHIEREVRSCVRRGVVCDLTWNTVVKMP